MRVDPQKDKAFALSDQWHGVDLDLNIFRLRDPDNPARGSDVRSFSGSERNRMFIRSGENFDDVSLVSGADSRQDGRGFVVSDFDRDGWLDMGVTSPLSPRLRIMRNRIGDRQPDNRGLFIQVEGGNDQPARSREWSSRDALGAKIEITTGDTQRMFQASCGEGLASQNSRWIHVGAGDAASIDRIRVLWPSGKETVHENVETGQRVTLKENGELIPDELESDP